MSDTKRRKDAGDEVHRLRARVAELEAERAATNAAVADLTVALRIAEAAVRAARPKWGES